MEALGLPPHAQTRALSDVAPRAASWMIAFFIGRRTCIRLDPKTGVLAWRTALYSTACVFGVVMLARPSGEFWVWWSSPQLLWRGWAFRQASAATRDVYGMYLGLYAHEWACVGLLDAPTRDRTAFLLHHIVTLVLVLSSWMLRMERIGAAIMLVHDGSDALLFAAKYAKANHRTALSQALFVLFAFSFYACRWGVLPFVWLRSIVTDAPTQISTDQEVSVFSPVCFGFATALAILQALQIMWGVRVGRAAIRQWSHGVLEDEGDAKTTPHED